MRVPGRQAEAVVLASWGGAVHASTVEAVTGSILIGTPCGLLFARRTSEMGIGTRSHATGGGDDRRNDRQFWYSPSWNHRDGHRHQIPRGRGALIVGTIINSGIAQDGSTKTRIDARSPSAGWATIVGEIKNSRMTHGTDERRMATIGRKGVAAVHVDNQQMNRRKKQVSFS